MSFRCENRKCSATVKYYDGSIKLLGLHIHEPNFIENAAVLNFEELKKEG